MNKTILGVPVGCFCLVLGVCSSSVESYAEPAFGMALKGGLDAATLSYEYRVERYGVSGGFAGYCQRALNERLSFAAQLELLYSQRGAETVIDGVSQGRIREHYVDVVIAARPSVRFGAASGYLLLGGGLNFLLSADNRDATGPSRDVTDDLHRIDVAVLVGAGVALHLPAQELGPVSLGSVFLEARHDRGLTVIDEMDLGFKNRNSSLMIGLSFRWGSVAATPSTSPSPSKPL